MRNIFLILILISSTALHAEQGHRACALAAEDARLAVLVRNATHGVPKQLVQSLREPLEIDLEIKDLENQLSQLEERITETERPLLLSADYLRQKRGESNRVSDHIRMLQTKEATSGLNGEEKLQIESLLSRRDELRRMIDGLEALQARDQAQLGQTLEEMRETASALRLQIRRLKESFNPYSNQGGRFNFLKTSFFSLEPKEQETAVKLLIYTATESSGNAAIMAMGELQLLKEALLDAEQNLKGKKTQSQAEWDRLVDLGRTEFELGELESEIEQTATSLENVEKLIRIIRNATNSSYGTGERSVYSSGAHGYSVPRLRSLVDTP